jgi:hypothetical protein
LLLCLYGCNSQDIIPFEVLASSDTTGDNFGYSVSISGDTIVVGADQEDSNATGVNGDQSNNGANDAGAAFVFVREGTTWNQQAYLKASNTDRNYFFGISVSISGDTIVVGAYQEDCNANGVRNGAPMSGAAYVFVREGTTWTQQAYLKASNTGFGDLFGISVSISGDTIVVGAKAEDSNATGVNGDQNNDDVTGSGAAYVFVRNGTTWAQQAYLKASNTGEHDSFGSSVSISGDTIVVGAQFEDSNATGVNGDQKNDEAFRSGAAYVFVRHGAAWTQQAYLKEDTVLLGGEFGCAVFVDQIIVVSQCWGNRAFMFVSESIPTTGTTGITGTSVRFIHNSFTDTLQITSPLVVLMIVHRKYSWVRIST